MAKRFEVPTALAYKRSDPESAAQRHLFYALIARMASGYRVAFYESSVLAWFTWRSKSRRGQINTSATFKPCSRNKITC